MTAWSAAIGQKQTFKCEPAVMNKCTFPAFSACIRGKSFQGLHTWLCALASMLSAPLREPASRNDT